MHLKFSNLNRCALLSDKDDKFVSVKDDKIVFVKDDKVVFARDDDKKG